MTRKVPEKVKILLIPLVIVLSIIFISILFLKPQISGILAGQREVSLQKDKLAKLTAKAAFLEGLQESELEIKTKTALSFLPAEKDLPGTLATIRNLVNSNGLELRGVQVGPGDISTGSSFITAFKKTPDLQSGDELNADVSSSFRGNPAFQSGEDVIKSEKSGLESLEFKITISGDWTQLKSFLSQVEEASPLMRIIKAEISSFPPMVEAALSLDSFSLSLPTTLGASETPMVAISPQEEEVYQQLVKTVPPIQEVSQSSSSGPSGRENPFIF